MSVLCLMFVCYVFAALDYARVLLQSTDDVSVRHTSMMKAEACLTDDVSVRHTSHDESRSLPYRLEFCITYIN